MLGELRRVERDLVEQLLHDGVQAARADVLGALVDDRREVGDALDGAGRERASTPSVESSAVLLDERALRLGQDADEVLAAERLELDADREAALQLGDEVRRLRDVERAGGDEQDVVGPHHAVFRVDRRAFDDRQDVALHAFAADVGAVAALAPGDLVDLVDEDDAGLLHALDRRARDALHVDQLLLFFLGQRLERLRHAQLALLRPSLEQAGQHVLDVDVDFLDRRPGDDLERREALLATSISTCL